MAIPQTQSNVLKTNALNGAISSTLNPTAFGGNSKLQSNIGSGLSINPQGTSQPVGSTLANLSQPTTTAKPFFSNTSTASTGGTIQGASGSTTTNPNSQVQPITPAIPTTQASPGYGNSTSGGTVPTTNSQTPYIPSATPNYAAGQGYGPSGAPVTTQTDPSQTYGTGLNTQMNYATGAGNPNVNTAISGLQSQSTNSPQAASQGYLQGIAQNGNAAVTQAQNQYNQFAQSAPGQINVLKNDPNELANIATGNAANATEASAATQSALAQNVTNAQNQEAQQIGAANEAGGLALNNQGQQITAGSNAGATAQTQQSAQIGSANAATGQASPVTQFGVLTNPVSGNPVNGGTAQSAAFNGGQIQNSQTQGGVYSNNTATLQALNGQDGQSGMVGSFNQALQNAGTNTNSLNLANALNQGLNANTSGVYATLQNSFQNILQQYAKILGPQTVNNLMTSSQSGTIGNFLNSLTSAAQQVQSGLQSTGTGQTQSTSQNSNSSGGSQWSF